MDQSIKKDTFLKIDLKNQSVCLLQDVLLLFLDKRHVPVNKIVEL